MATIANLNIRLSAQIAEFQSEFREAAKTADKFAENFEGIATRAAAVGAFIGNIAADIAQSLVRGFGNAFKDAIRLSSEFSNAFIGLSSVARAFGTDADLASAAARRLSSDGLLPLKDSATGLKNLLAAGFNLDQAVKLMDAFKDSAAFGRQSALSFGDAVRSATEGVKNGNSILVDNAGVTKNLSQILKEAGFSAQDLSRASSDAAVRMALFNGILKETVAQTGDAERLTQTYSGQVAKLSATYDNLLANLGTAITQNASVAKAIGFVGDAFFRLSQHLSNNRNAFNFVSDAVIAFARGLSALVGVLDIVQKSFQAFVIVLNTFLSDIVVGARAIFGLVARVEELQKVLDPIRFRQHAAAAQEARQAYEFLDRIATTLARSTQTAMDQGTAWGRTLQGLKGTLDGLSKELEATRGKTVELGVSGAVAGSALGTGIETGSKKAQDALVKLKKTYEDLFPGVKEGLSSLPGFKVDLPKLEDFVLPDFSDLGPKIKEGLSSLPGTKIPVLRIPIELPPAAEIKNAFNGVVEASRQTARDVAFAISDGVVQHLPQPLRTDLSRVFDEAINAVADRGLSGLIDVGKKFAKDTALGIVTELASTLPKEFRAIAVNAIEAFRQGGLAGLGRFALDAGKKFASDFLGELLGMVPVVGGVLKGLAKPVVEFLSGIFGNKGRDIVKDFAASFGGFDALHRRLLEMGAAGEVLWVKLTQGVGRNNPEQAAAVVQEVQAALQAFGTEAQRAGIEAEKSAARVAGIGSAIDALNAKAKAFASPFQELLKDKDVDDVKAKLAAMGEAGQAEFERIGTFAAAAFAGLVKETGDAIGAIQKLGPTFQVLQDGVDKFGLTTSGTIDFLLHMFSQVNDAVTGPILQAIQTTGQIFEGLQTGGILTAELFQTVATDIGASFRELEAKGGDVAAAMALSQPVLQRLWEAQRTYGKITDETTQKILEQAEQQGLVGDHMKDVNQKILDVLIAIADVFGAVIPDSMRATRDAATQTAEHTERAFSNIKVPKITVDVGWDFDDFNPDREHRGVEHLASGGIVRRPTLALVGEAGPEAVIPLNQLGSVAPSGESTVIFEIDGRQIAAATVPYLPGEARRYVPA